MLYFKSFNLHKAILINIRLRIIEIQSIIMYLLFKLGSNFGLQILEYLDLVLMVL